VQIVHDLKNQLNGLKLYATFLRRRIEKSERPTDEQETVTKLINGLDRAAEDLSTIVKYGQPLELKKQPGFEIAKVLRTVCSSVDDSNSHLIWRDNSDDIQGNFDHFKLTDAFRWLSMAALKHRQTEPGASEESGVGDATSEITLTANLSDDSERVVIEWSGLRQLDKDPFRSFAGSDEIKLALAAKIIEAHGGSATFVDKKFVVELPLSG
jgi:signal transduction histidine kinase